MDTEEDKNQTPPDSSPGVEAAPSETEEEAKKRSAEGRINELISKIKEQGREIEDLRTKVNTPPVPAPPIAPDNSEVKPEVRQAIEVLKKTGKFVDQEDMNQQIKNLQDRITLDSEHNRLERVFDGADGRPTYDRREIEDYMRRRGVYDPEVAYKALHENELLDWSLKEAEKDRKKKPFVAKPGGSTAQAQHDSTITREKINEWLTGGPEGRAQYEAHRKEILDMYAKGQL